ncbi:protoporphyrinogen oxidase [soil metagenome]
MRARRIVVVGAGIAGLTAAHELARQAPGTDVLVLEGAERVGGKLRVSEIAGMAVDEGAEAALARVPEALDLIESLGLGADVVHPATTSAWIALDGALLPVPECTLLGVPADLDALERSGLLSAAGLDAVRRDLAEPGPPVTEDVGVGVLLRERLGAEIVDRLVEPLLGGVYAGSADLLSLRATMPALAEALREQGSVVAAARAARAATPSRDGPVFATLRGGLARLPLALAADPAIEVRTGSPVRELHRTEAHFRVIAGRTPGAVTADAVILAVPGTKASLLGTLAPSATAELAAVHYAGMAIVTFAIARQELPAGSGLLVPPTADTVVKAVTLSSQKWPHLDQGEHVVIRASVGRRGEERVLRWSDGELAARAYADLRRLLGLTGEPVAVRVSRWGGALPQYDVGQVERVQRIRAALA